MIYSYYSSNHQVDLGWFGMIWVVWQTRSCIFTWTPWHQCQDSLSMCRCPADWSQVALISPSRTNAEHRKIEDNITSQKYSDGSIHRHNEENILENMHHVISCCIHSFPDIALAGHWLVTEKLYGSVSMIPETVQGPRFQPRNRA